MGHTSGGSRRPGTRGRTRPARRCRPRSRGRRGWCRSAGPRGCPGARPNPAPPGGRWPDQSAGRRSATPVRRDE
ncbi:hypothetical protein DSY14_27025 [Nocardiopsis sp. MG754419]|nr:hypothetical protein [Nocardiopsis sp. MG754419]